LTRLGVDVIDVYRPARLDPAVPIEDTIGAIADLVKGGYVRYIGLSEVGVRTIERAHQVHPISDLQIEYSLASRAPEAEIFPALRRLGISATLYGVLSRGLLAGSEPKGQGDFRAYLPRFSGDNRDQNQQAVARLASFAEERGMSRGQLAIAWALARAPGFVPLVGAKTRAQLSDALGALEKPLSAGDLAALETLLRPETFAGSRYDSSQMAHLDSEK
jgi:aryl-alcohol dehydrogenase-like predicted oxidoreductase